MLPVVLTVAGVVGLLFGGLWLWQALPEPLPDDATASSRSTDPLPAPTRTADRPEPEPGDAEAEPPPAGGTLALAADQPAAWLTGSRGPRIAVQASMLLDRPASAGLDGLSVVHHDAPHDLLLLAPSARLPGEPAPPPAPARAAAGLAIGTSLWAGGPAADDDAAVTLHVALESHEPDGRLRIAGVTPPGAVLRDDSGAVVGLVARPGVGLAIDPVIPWLGQPAGDTLGALRPELRAAHPALLVEDGRALLDRGESAPLDELQAMLARILRLPPGAPANIPAMAARDALESLMRIRIAARLQDRSPREALAVVAEGVDRHPDDLALVEVATNFEAAYGAPDRTVQRHRTLGILDAERARRVAPGCADHLTARAQGLPQAERPTWLAAAEQIEPTPARALALARALLAAGRTQEAVAAAERARSLPEGARLLETLRAAAQPGTVQLPIPDSGTVRATASVHGQPVRFVVDTGASMTTIPTGTARALGLLGADNQRVEVTTASGKAIGLRVTLPSLRIGDLTLTDVDAIALDLPGALQQEGLLGMTALGRLRVTVDGDARVMTLQSR